MPGKIIIDPVTRLEGHGRILIHTDKNGRARSARFIVPDFRGFEKFCEKRAVEELPTLTQKICGVCPTAHHTASCKALDHLFGANPPKAGRLVRELLHSAFIFEDHLLHLFYLGGPDLFTKEGLEDEPNIFGVMRRLGQKAGSRILKIRKNVRDMMARLGGNPLYPVCGLPGGVSVRVKKEDQSLVQEVSGQALELAKDTLALFYQQVLKQGWFQDLLFHPAFSLKTCYMGLVDKKKQVNFYEGEIHVTDPEGNPLHRFAVKDYCGYLSEIVVPESYMKILYLKRRGFSGLTEKQPNGIYRVGPLARLNSAESMATPIAAEAYGRMFGFFKKKPVHNTLAYHWARIIEILYAAERMGEIARDPELLSPEVRVLPTRTEQEGFGVCEAPRGTLIHHYETDEKALVRCMNLIVATQNNAAALSMSVEKAARAFITSQPATKKMMSRVEMAYRAYDPCLACSTH